MPFKTIANIISELIRKHGPVIVFTGLVFSGLSYLAWDSFCRAQDRLDELDQQREEQMGQMNAKLDDSTTYIRDQLTSIVKANTEASVHFSQAVEANTEAVQGLTQEIRRERDR